MKNNTMKYLIYAFAVLAGLILGLVITFNILFVMFVVPRGGWY